MKPFKNIWFLASYQTKYQIDCITVWTINDSSDSVRFHHTAKQCVMVSHIYGEPSCNPLPALSSQ